MATNYRSKRYPAVIVTALVIVFSMIVGRAVKSAIDRMNPDNRAAEPLTRDVLKYRHRLNADQVGEISDSKVKYFAEEAECQMKLMQFWKSEEPQKPEPPKKIGEGFMAELKFKHDQKRYPLLLQSFPARKALWEANNESRGKFVFVPGKLPKNATQEEMKKKAGKYLYMDNIFGYVARGRLDMVALQFYHYQDNEYWQDQLGWVSKGFKEVKKSADAPKDASKKAKREWEQELFKDYIIDVYLSQPLVCPHDANGDCIKTWDGTSSREDADKGHDCLLVKPLAEAVERANYRMHKAGKGEIKPMICYRNNLHQAVLFVAIAGDGCSLSGERPGITLPGTSNHGLGLAMDISNWREAQVYLAAEAGMMCDYVPNDDAHCSIAEIALSRRVVLKKRVLDARADGRDIKEFIKEHGGDIINNILNR
jgi:hypothetical protein